MDKKTFEKIVGNRFFEVAFTKKDGSERLMNGRLKVHKYIKGTGSPVIDGRLVIMDRIVFRENVKAGMRRWDAGNKAYRSLWPDTVKWVKVNGHTYNADGEEVA